MNVIRSKTRQGILFGIVIVSAMVFSTWAQLTIEWSTIDGGGGVATGGSFAVRGTIGQPDAESSSGGDFTLYGGFWVPVAIQVEGAPWLYIEAVGSTNVMVYWEPDVAGWVLQQTLDLLATNWTDAASGNTNYVSIPATDVARFYRLRSE